MSLKHRFHESQMFDLIINRDWSRLLPLLNEESCGTVCQFHSRIYSMTGKPLHHCVHRGAPACVIAKLLQLRPEVASEPVAQSIPSMLPLVLAIRAKSSFEVCNMLLAAYPQAASLKHQYSGEDEGRDGDGITALHVAAQANAKPDVLSLLLASHAMGAIEKCKKGLTPLAYALLNNADIDFVCTLLRFEPLTAAQRMGENEEGELPIHLAMRKGRDVRFLCALQEAYPQGIREVDHDRIFEINGNTPLQVFIHYARDMRLPESVAILNMLIDHDHCNSCNGNGDFALHSLFAMPKGYQTSIDLISLIGKKYPSALLQKNKRGFLPLHLALKQRCSSQVAEFLLDMAPQAVAITAPHLQSSLHLALVAKCDLAAVTVILKAHPEAVKEVDAESGMTLLHVAVRSYVFESTNVARSLTTSISDINNPGVEATAASAAATAVSVISLLLAANPSAISVVDKVHAALPVHYARSDAAVEELLHSAYPEGWWLVPFPFSFSISSSSSSSSSPSGSALTEEEGMRRGKGYAPVHVFEECEAAARLWKENANIAASDTQSLLVCMKERRKFAAAAVDATNNEAATNVDKLTANINLLLDRQRRQWAR